MTAPRPRKTYRADRRNTARDMIGAPWALKWPAAQRLIAAEIRAEQAPPFFDEAANYPADFSKRK